MVKVLLRLIVASVSVPILGGLLSLPSMAQTPALESNPQLSPLQRWLLEQKPDLKPASEPPPWSPPLPPVEPSVEQPVELILRLGERQLYVYRGNTLETTFPVAVGKPGWETPTGQFEVSYMLDQPGWTNPFTGEVVPPGPNNPLGERWIAFWTDGQNEIGFHGTPNRGSIGQAASHGCVRLYNEDIRELYTLVSPGTRVTVVP